MSDRDVYLHTLPMFHCNGWGMPYGLTGMGAKQVVLRKVDGAEILRRIDEHGVTLLNGAPAVANAILEAAADWEGEIPGSGRTRMVVAGAPPPTRTIERIETELGWEFIQIYGLTETSPLLTMNRGASRVRRAHSARSGPPGSAGPARRRIGVRLEVDDEGEVLARSNVVMDGYWNQPEATADAMEGGWFHTGDGGFLDGEGYLTIADRKKDVIISGGENVSSIEVEDVLFSHPAVAEVAVIGIPHEKWGETVTALVVARARRDRDGSRSHRALPRPPRALQVPDVDRVPRRARAHGDGQAPEVQAARALLGRSRAPRQLGLQTARSTRSWNRRGVEASSSAGRSGRCSRWGTARGSPDARARPPRRARPR